MAQVWPKLEEVTTQHGKLHARGLQAMAHAT